MGPNPQETVDLFAFTEEILNGKLHVFVQCLFNKQTAFIVGVCRAVDVFDHRMLKNCYCFLLSTIFLSFVC